jgi:hypothetical protein
MFQVKEMHLSYKDQWVNIRGTNTYNLEADATYG